MDEEAMKTVLGLHCLSHDAGAALISGGRVFAISEERLSGVKYDGGFPGRSIRYVMDAAGLQDVNGVDLVVFDHIDHCESRVREWLEHEIRFRGDVHAVKHHDAHAASAFHVSPFQEAAVLVVDACGSFADETETGCAPEPLGRRDRLAREAQSFFMGRGRELKLVKRTYVDADFSLGIGILYALASLALGFGELGAGKVMGLAAFGGKPDIFTDSILKEYQGEIKAPGIPGRDPLRPENFEIYSRKLFGAGLRAGDSVLTNRHAEIAALVQREAQNAMKRLVENIHKQTGAGKLCLSGGLALNSIANSMIRDRGPFDEVFIQPAATDTGIPLGCALFGYHNLLEQDRFMVQEHVYFGRPYSRTEIETALKAARGVKWTRPRRLLPECAELLSRGKVLGWFKGGSELGPRALGHRSILADPRDPKMKDHLNASVKRREMFRPYAPVVLQERVSEYFMAEKPCPFMLHVAEARPGMENKIPAVLHIDGTSRIQTLGRKICPELYDLIQEFEKITGVPMLLNTSFNTAGHPIVETPEDALNTFLGSGMDFLVIEDFLVRKTDSPH